jgi:hypothetical protein
MIVKCDNAAGGFALHDDVERFKFQRRQGSASVELEFRDGRTRTSTS